MINTLKIDTNKTIEYMNDLRDIINMLQAEINTCNNENEKNQLKSTLLLHSAKLNSVETILIMNGYTAEYINETYIIY